VLPELLKELSGLLLKYYKKNNFTRAIATLRDT